MLVLLFICLKGHLGVPWEDNQHVVIDEFLCMVAGCASGTGVCHWMFKIGQHGSGHQDGLLVY